MGTVERGRCLRNARRAKRLTQAELCDGLCTPEVVSRVENGRARVSDELINALLHRAGIRENATPGFKGKSDFKARYNLALAEADINVFKFDNAVSLLNYVRDIDFGGSTSSLQKWICLMTAMQLFMGYNDYELMEKNIHYALLLTSDSMYAEKIYTAVEKKLYFELLTCKILEHDKPAIDELVRLMNRIDRKYLSRETESDLTTYLYYRILRAFANCELSNSDDLYDYEKLREKVDESENAALTLIYHSIHAHICYKCGRREMGLEELRLVSDTAYLLKSPLLIDIAGHTRSVRVVNYIKELEDYFSGLKEITKVSDYTVIHVKEALQGETVYTLGDVIHDERLSQGVTLHELSEGLCSASKLSKIERNKQKVSYFLTQSLLQRLNINDDLLRFYLPTGFFSGDSANKNAISSDALEKEENDGVKAAMKRVGRDISVDNVGGKLLSKTELYCLNDLMLRAAERGDKGKFEHYRKITGLYLRKHTLGDYYVPSGITSVRIVIEAYFKMGMYNTAIAFFTEDMRTLLRNRPREYARALNYYMKAKMALHIADDAREAEMIDNFKALINI